MLRMRQYSAHVQILNCIPFFPLWSMYIWRKKSADFSHMHKCSVPDLSTFVFFPLTPSLSPIYYWAYRYFRKGMMMHWIFVVWKTVWIHDQEKKYAGIENSSYLLLILY